MNPYDHDVIENFLDIRLVDCFLKQNQNNDWLSVDTIASWVFQTNKPTGYHRNYCQSKLVGILGMAWTSQEEKSFLEKGRSATNRYTYVYRLKDASQIIDEETVAKSIADQIEESFAASVESPAAYERQD